jgi:hypothetical protein
LRNKFIALSVFVVTFAITVPLCAQNTPMPPAATGHITGTVTDFNGDTLAGASVLLQGPGPQDARKIESNETGFFDFGQLPAGTYHVIATAPDFTDWTSPELVLSPSQYMILSDCKLRVATVTTTVNVGYKPEQIAMEEVKAAETQRVFGIIPNFYVVYDHNPAPLTAKAKFHLALRNSTDAVTIVGVLAYAGINQAGNNPDYRQGWNGYGERVGASAADGLSDLMMGGAILPSLLHQDPRYHYKGTGTTTERLLYALRGPLVCWGDNGKLQPNYSSIGGDLSSAALSNIYYPPSNRGAGLVFENFGIMTSERMLSTVLQEFVLGRLTSRRRGRE